MNKIEANFSAFLSFIRSNLVQEPPRWKAVKSKELRLSHDANDLLGKYYDGIRTQSLAVMILRYFRVVPCKNHILLNTLCVFLLLLE